PSAGWAGGMRGAPEYRRRPGRRRRRIGVEIGSLPMDSGAALRSAFPDSEIVDALFVLERLRARKTPAELEKLRVASERVIDSMLAVIAQHGPGTTKQQLADALKVEEVNRGLTLEYCLLAAGASHNRAPSAQRWEKGEVLSLDSGGNYHGYIGDLARMAILGDPDAELEDMLADIEATQRAAMMPIKAGVMGGDIYAAAEAALARSRYHNHTH